ncbi:MAG TPA: ABC transporter permease [Acidimicrobiales bacterium]|nr:ABC transporter permease [Acidimicrobiales bacterium]
MSVFLSFTVLGIVTGAVYGILATGLVVTYNTTGVFNFAQGAVGMVAAFSYWQLWQDWHWPFLLAIAVVVFVEAPLLAIAVEFVLFRRIHGASVERSLMVSLGLLVILLGLATIFWGSPQVIRSVPPYFTAADGSVASVHLFGSNGVTLQVQQIMIVVVAAVVAVGLGVYLRRFRLGVAMRAVVDDPELVAMSGAKPYRMSQMGWALGFMLAALAGVLIAPLVGQTGLTSTQLTLLALNGFAAAVVGRLRNLPMTFVGALMLGLITQYCVGYLPGHINPGLASVLTEVVPVVFLFVVLLVIPAARLAPAGRLATRPVPKVVTARQSVAGGVLLVAGMVVLAVVAGATALATLSQGLAFGIVGLSLVLLVGFAGQVSLCQLTFMGIGAFTMGKAFGGDSWWGLLLAVVVSGAVGALVALPAMRLRGLYLALATFAFGEVMYSAFFNNSSVISDGTSIPVGRLPLPFMHTVSDQAELIEVVVAAALCAMLVGLLRRRAFGRRLVAMSDSPTAFATMGLNSVRTKVVVFSLSAAMAGLGGVFYAGQQGGIGANDVQFITSLTLLLFVCIWGIRTIAGALLGGMTQAALPVLQTHLPASLADVTGLAAGIGIFLLARHPEGILGIEWLTRRISLPFGEEPAPAAQLLLEQDVARAA